MDGAELRTDSRCLEWLGFHVLEAHEGELAVRLLEDHVDEISMV